MGQIVVSGHILENAWRELPEIFHADVSWPPSQLIKLWSQSGDFLPFGATFTYDWSHPTIGPIQFLAPIRFLARKGE